MVYDASAPLNVKLFCGMQWLHYLMACNAAEVIYMQKGTLEIEIACGTKRSCITVQIVTFILSLVRLIGTLPEF